MTEKKRGRPRKRARTDKGRFIADNPNTKKNEAYVSEKPTIIERIKIYAKKVAKIFRLRKI
ncbi:hypothetical protein [Hyphomonas sp.]|uniref:hypothetical protein n=1 Tax=Hyphomonas sp. TaxID=87 RepID=UPI0025BAAECF|nr:hypothetical protein [Hyphomonas sp.]